MAWLEESFSLSSLHLQNAPGGWLGVLIAGATLYISYRFGTFFHYQYRVGETKKKIRKRQDQRNQNLSITRAEVYSKTDTFDPSVTRLEFKELQRRLQNGELKAIEVLLAFQFRALQAHDELNCVTEFLEDAKDRATKLDQLPSHLRGPLHGIPISLKEGVVLAGRDATTGFARSIGETFEEDSVLVKVLVDQGAVPFARTNLPQAQMSFECSNPIFGVTRNPKNPRRTPGGSSGGEGALIGAGGSILGIGCDMAGSIRVPVHFCGITGIKCTSHRLSDAGNYPFGLGIIALAEVYSPLGRDVDTVVEFMKATLVPRLYELDRHIPRMPWNDEVYKSTQPLKIGYYTWDGGIEPVPSVKRAVMLAVENLQKAGHTVVEFNPPDVLYAFEHLFMSVISGDGGQHAVDALKYDVIDPCIQALIDAFERPMPSFVKKLITLLPGTHPITKILINFNWPRNISAWWDKNEDIEMYRRKFSNQMTSQGIECLVCPTLPFPAWPIEQADHNFESCTYTTLYNVLDFPAGVVPTTTVTELDVEQMTDYPDNTAVHKYVHEITKGSEGLPIGVQCVGLPFEEEKTLRLMKELENSLLFIKNGKKIPHSPQAH